MPSFPPSPPPLAAAHLQVLQGVVPVGGPVQDVGQLAAGQHAGPGQGEPVVGAVAGGQQAQQLQDGGQRRQAVGAVLAEGLVDVSQDARQRPRVALQTTVV